MSALLVTLRIETDEKAEIQRMFQVQLKALENMTGIKGQVVEIKTVTEETN
jgi:hypothetical protein